MRQLTVSFCSGVDEKSEVYDAVTDVLDLFEESDRLYEQNFEMPEDNKTQCMALQVSVEDEFYDNLKKRLIKAIQTRHGCDVVVGEYDEADRPDVIHGECQLFEDDEDLEE